MASPGSSRPLRPQPPPAHFRFSLPVGMCSPRPSSKQNNNNNKKPKMDTWESVCHPSTQVAEAGRLLLGVEANLGYVGRLCFEQNKTEKGIKSKQVNKQNKTNPKSHHTNGVFVGLSHICKTPSSFPLALRSPVPSQHFFSI